MNTIAAVEFGRKLAAGEAQHAVDVRTPAEFAECHVAGAKLSGITGLFAARRSCSTRRLGIRPGTRTARERTVYLTKKSIAAGISLDFP